MHEPNEQEDEDAAREQECRDLRRGGAIGGAVARAFAREGARTFLAGRTLEPLEAVAGEISTTGGVAETAQVDALDGQAVERHLGGVVDKAGGIDVSFNAISIREVQDPARGDVARGFHESDHDRHNHAFLDR